jgi:O-antigen ligase
VFIFSFIRYSKLKRELPTRDHYPPQPIPGSVIKRTVFTIILLVAGASIAVISVPALFEVIQARFADIFSFSASGAIWKRMLLWNNAFTAFWDHPLVGVGPGNYKVIHTIYPAIHLEFVHFFVRGLNAHNLVLHYLAETGLVGTIPMVLLIFNQFRLSRRRWHLSQGIKELQVSAALYAIGISLLLTTFIEADWMWGFAGYTFVFFVALISGNFSQSAKSH